MSSLSKLTFKTLAKPAQVDPIQKRRDKIIAAIDLQSKVLAAALEGESFSVPAKIEGKPAKAIRPWFFEQDGGFVVVCKYGARPVLLNGKDNAVFVPKLSDVSIVLTAFAAATKAGELDKAIAAASERKKG